jgi:hypothetical protein
LVAFNVKDINGKVYVTYAPSGRPAQIAATGGMGAVAVFEAACGLSVGDDEEAGSDGA